MPRTSALLSFHSSVALAAGAVISSAACGPLSGPARGPEPPAFTPHGNQSKCRVMQSQLRPLIVEWSSADRAALEVLAQRGTVAVRYAGCEMEVLPRCRAPGAYSYKATTRKTEQVTIRNDDELYASLPIGAAKLEGKLASRGQLDVTMNVVGQYGTDQTSVTREALEGDCSKATHVVTGLTVGAFQFTAGAGTEASGGGSVVGVGAGGRTSSSRETLSSDGDVAACERATRDDKQPPESCGGLLRIEVEPIGDGAGVAGGIGSCPAGTKLADGKCEPTQTGQSTLPNVPTRILVQVSCGMDMSFVGTREGLRVWIDGEPVVPAEEPRVFNPMSPGAIGPVQYVAFDATPGTHTVRVESAECQSQEATVQVNAGVPRPLLGRLQPTSFFARPPAGGWSLGLIAEYSMLGLSSLKVENSNYEETPMDADTLSGFGGALTMSTQHVWVDMGFGRVGGDATFIRPTCSTPADCPLAGTEAEAELGIWQIPLLVGFRLPLHYLSATAGSGIVWNITSVDAGDADDDLSTISPMGVHVPAFLGVEVRPLCQLGIGARAAKGFALGSAVGDMTSVTFTLGYHATMGCTGEDFGIQ